MTRPTLRRLTHAVTALTVLALLLVAVWPEHIGYIAVAVLAAWVGAGWWRRGR